MRNSVELLEERLKTVQRKLIAFKDAPTGEAKREWLRENIGDAEVYLKEELKFLQAVLKDLK